MEVPLSQARPGDILVFKRSGLVANILSWLIVKIREPKWDRYGWHLAPIVAGNAYLDAQFPRVKLSLISDIKREVKCYRVFQEPPSADKISLAINYLLDKPYDCLVYFWTFLWAIHLVRFRIINPLFTCWETTYAALECWDFDIDWTDCNYPFITDLLRSIGELK